MEGEGDELEKALGELEAGQATGTESPGTPPGSPSSVGETRETTPASPAAGEGAVFAEVAGRKYPTKEDLFKSHEAAVRELQTLKKWSDPWRRYEQALRQDPELYKWLKGAETKYREFRARGASPGEAARASGIKELPKEVVEFMKETKADLAEYRQGREDKRLDVEIDGLRTSYKLDDAGVKKVLAEMEVVARKGWEIDADEAYWRIQAREGREAFQKTKTELDRVKADATTTTRPPESGSPSRPPRRKTKEEVIEKGTEQEFDQALNEEADRLLLKENE